MITGNNSKPIFLRDIAKLLSTKIIRRCSLSLIFDEDKVSQKRANNSISSELSQQGYAIAKRGQVLFVLERGNFIGEKGNVSRLVLLREKLSRNTSINDFLT